MAEEEEYSIATRPGEDVQMEEELEVVEPEDDLIEKPLSLRVDAKEEAFYLQYYSGHTGRFGHEFLEFDFQLLDQGRSALLRYANNSNYKNDTLIRREVAVSPVVVKVLKKMIKESEILKENDAKWPPKNRDGKQELEIKFANYHIAFETGRIGSLSDVQRSDDPEGLRTFYYLVQDIKALVFSLVGLHFKIKPI
ncbi:Mago nashi protein-domain-containing protein [Yarrowia lipolytica]|jgi:protein mago nashi|uniref:YALI0D26664p n=2 Tax=Yarrowia lipolytica TaxID=4952 RepID=Q6C7N5_YARLI|nr:YALI0D26664p [Yarrowia lipolytica CLIB122]AOW04694.1 hypothetical protein YALI1_D35210g [Yarrowia lipolytica]KAB8283963.1 Mago nashi protein-domain-containing protein [Yarrowia lipolytica]KAE8172142.1 Mago nashi protein-domain-containing protein [Yarrowia lipolytica]KAJ8053883.1 Mago nashi protein-domain-containing protein [Yarrowia lipolytica]QNP98161.1 Protein mago nashi [Yarrowia lipolytica]|eukprot:XP_503327.1 YALI0D26664p [Yarrowia lipolytica CLIB122]